MCLNIVQDLTQSKVGLENLKETYASDLQFVCNIDTIIQAIDAKMKDVESKYVDIIKYQNKNLNNNSLGNIDICDGDSHLHLQSTSIKESIPNVITEDTEEDLLDPSKTSSTKSCSTVNVKSPPYYTLTEPRSPPSTHEIFTIGRDNFRIDEDSKNEETKTSIILPLLKTSNLSKTTASPLSHMVKERNLNKPKI